MIHVLFLLFGSTDCAAVSRENVVQCAQAQSPTLLAEQASVRAGEGRRDAARPFLPSNPVVSASVASRTSAQASALNWYVTLEQQLEIAGQSWVRTEAAERELEAARHQLLVARAEVAELVWNAFFLALASKERAALATEVQRASAAVAATVEGMRANGLASPVEASVADAAAVRATQNRLGLERQRREALTRLATLLAREGLSDLDGVLEPLNVEGDATTRPERLALEALREAATKRIESLKRDRAPNPTLSVFAQNDGFDERVLGVGVGLPIPLPQPVGRTNAGQIAEAVALEERARAQLLQLERSLGAEKTLAAADLEDRKQARALYSRERLERARAGLVALTEQLQAGRLSVREALTTQQALVELLEADVDARLALCVASVRWRRAQGLSLEGGAL